MLKMWWAFDDNLITNLLLSPLVKLF